jgi:hypothetical protein
VKTTLIWLVPSQWLLALEVPILLPPDVKNVLELKDAVLTLVPLSTESAPALLINTVLPAWKEGSSMVNFVLYVELVLPVKLWLLVLVALVSLLSILTNALLLDAPKDSTNPTPDVLLVLASTFVMSEVFDVLEPLINTVLLAMQDDSEVDKLAPLVELAPLEFSPILALV